jgi:heparinase II/III-like protein
LRSLLRALREQLSPSATRRPYYPDFTDERLFAELALGGRDCANLARALEAFERGDQSTSVAHVAEHFRRRHRPRFLVDIHQLSSLLAHIDREHPEWKRRTVEHAERECDEGLAVFSRRTGPVRTGLDWSALPPGPGDDLLYSVGPHFFEFAPRMALAAAYGAATGASLERTVVAWMRMAARGESPLPYFSDLTAGLRVLALSWALAFLAGSADGAAHEDGRLEVAVLKILRADGEFLETVVEEASPNNHMLTAGFVLWYLGTLLPELAGSRRWREQGLRVWLRELERQTLPDGGGFEHAIGYHRSVCEAASVFILLGQRNGHDIPEWILERTRRALEFHIAVGGAQPTAFGDSSDYSLFPLPRWSGSTPAGIRELGRAMFGLRCASASSEDPGVEQAFWLLGGSLAGRPDEPEPVFSLRSYPDSGCHVFSSQERGTQLLFRAGPPPARPLFAGHMHSDLLSIYLTSRGLPIVVEAGTYTYRTAAGPWRSYFAGPESHNGLAIRGHDPLGGVAGDFRPRDAAVRVKSRSEAAPALVGWAEGVVQGSTMYAGHRRGVITLDLGFWVVYDTVGDQVPLSDVSFGFQLAPGSRALHEPGGAVRVEVSGEEVVIVPSEGFRAPSVDTGQLNPAKGWVSPRYGERVPAPQVRFESNEKHRHTAFILSQARGGRRCLAVGVETLACGSTVIEVDWSDCTDRMVIRRGSGTTRAFGGEFDGTLLWLRSRGSEPVALRWLHGQSVRLPGFSVEIRAERSVDALGVEATPGGLTVTGTEEPVSVDWPRASLSQP